MNKQVQPGVGQDLAGSLPEFPQHVGGSLTDSAEIAGFRAKRLIFSRLDQPGAVHVYSAKCQAGERLRVQILIPVLPLGGGLSPAFAVVAQSLPYSADVHKLPFALPAGYSAVVAPPPGDFTSPVEDRLTHVRYYPGPVVDTRTLVSGRCYIVVWSPRNQMGKYALAGGPSVADQLALLAAHAGLLVADSRVVWPQPRGGLCRRGERSGRAGGSVGAVSASAIKRRR